MLGETNSSTLSTSRTGSKCCNPQIKKHHKLLFCSTLECYPLLYLEVVLSLMASLMKWFSCTSLLALLLSCVLGNVGVWAMMWPSDILSNSHCFEIQGHLCHTFMIGQPITKRSLIVLPSPFIQAHIFGQRVRFMLKLSRPHRLALKSKFPLELRDISVVRDILDVFLEVSPCCHMTVMSSSWVAGSLNHSFLQGSMLDTLD